MTIPASFKVDFSEARKDLIAQAIERLLSQFECACALKQVVLAFMGEVQCLYDATVDLQEKRTLHAAEGENLAALGRIVGQDNLRMQYDASHWMTADQDGRSPDTAPAWSLRAPAGMYVPSGDAGFSLDILARIAKNHTLTASVPEMQRLIRMVTGKTVSIDKTGPMEGTVIVPQDLALSFWHMLTQARSNKRMDDVFMMPYPATFWFRTIYVHNPERPENLNWFCADRTNEQRCDRAPCIVGIPMDDPNQGGNWVDPDPDYHGVTIYLPENWLCADRTNAQRCDRALAAVGVPIRQTAIH